MTELLAEGGCYNGMRFAIDGAGADTRNFRGDINTSQAFTDAENLILCVCFDGDDMNEAANATFKIQWRNHSDDPGGTWINLADTGELKWDTSSDLTDGAALHTDAYADSPSSVNCSTKGWSVEGNSEEVEGANGTTITATDDELLEIHWAIALDDGDAANADEYEFRVTQSDDTEIGLMVGKLTIAIAGKIDLVTRNANRTATEGSVKVICYNSDGGSPPAPTGLAVTSGTSNGSGVLSLTTSIFSGQDYILVGAKSGKSDATIPVTAVDL